MGEEINMKNVPPIRAGAPTIDKPFASGDDNEREVRNLQRHFVICADRFLNYYYYYI
jgi:hypothetical protein